MTTREQNSGVDPSDSAMAIAGLTLCKNATRGRAPEFHEIEDWQEGRLSETRSAEVMSYIANDPEYFQMWSDICEAHSYAIEEQNEAIWQSNAEASSATLADTPGTRVDGSRVDGNTGWLAKLRDSFTMPQLAGAMAAVLGALIIIPLFTPDSGLSVDGYYEHSLERYLESGAAMQLQAPSAKATKGLAEVLGDAAVQQPDRYNARFGLKRVASEMLAKQSPQDEDAWQAWLETLPSELLDCSSQPDSEACVQNADTFQAAGSWTLLTHAQCQQDGLSRKHFHDEDLVLFNTLKDNEAIQSSDILSSTFTSGASESLESLCASAATLIEKIR